MPTGLNLPTGTALAGAFDVSLELSPLLIPQCHPVDSPGISGCLRSDRGHAAGGKGPGYRGTRSLPLVNEIGVG
jgi:hypothetical protein